jgi:hypothetical protein
MASASSQLLQQPHQGAAATTYSPPPSPYSAVAGAFGRSHPLALGGSSSDASDDGHNHHGALLRAVPPPPPASSAAPPPPPPPEQLLEMEEDDAVASFGVVSALEAAPPVAMRLVPRAMPSAFGGGGSLLASSLGWAGWPGAAAGPAPPQQAPARH